MLLLFSSKTCPHILIWYYPPDPPAHGAVGEINQYFKHKSLFARIYMHVSSQKNFK